VRSALERFIATARAAGLDDESIAALVADTLRFTEEAA